MALKRAAAVVSNRARQKVILDVGPGNSGSGPDESTGLEMIGAAEPGSTGQPLATCKESAKLVQFRIQRYRLLASVLKIDFQMILQILAHTREFVDDVDAGRLQKFCRIDSRTLQQCG